MPEADTPPASAANDEAPTVAEPAIGAGDPLFAEPAVQFVLRTLLRLGAPTRDVEDLAQEVFVIAHRRRRDYDARRRPEPWLYGIARNVLRDYRKLARNRREAIGVDEQQLGGTSVTPSGDAGLLHWALAQLAEPLQDVVILCDLSELTVLETAQALGVPEGTVKDRLRRGRAELRQHVERARQEVARV